MPLSEVKVLRASFGNSLQSCSTAENMDLAVLSGILKLSKNEFFALEKSLNSPYFFFWKTPQYQVPNGQKFYDS